MKGQQEKRDIRIVVGGDEAGVRADKFLSGKIPDVSRTWLQRRLAEGQIKINGKVVPQAYKVCVGDQIRGEVLQFREEVKSEGIPLHVLYEDDCLLVIHKQPGLTVHPTPNRTQGTLVNALLNYGCRLSPLGGNLRPGIVHRLDKGTSGVMVVAKTERAHRGLMERFRRREVEKIYEALTWGMPRILKQADQIVLSRHPRRRLKMAVNVSSEGRVAVTTFRVKELLGELNLVEAFPKTGRTHQVRAHLSHLGSPILGDSMYGGSAHSPGGTPIPKGMVRRPMLHAARLSFEHPCTRERVSFEAALAEDMARVLVLLRNAVKRAVPPQEDPKGS